MIALIFLIGIPVSIVAICSLIDRVKTSGKALIQEDEGCVWCVDETGCLVKRLVEYDRF